MLSFVQKMWERLPWRVPSYASFLSLVNLSVLAAKPLRLVPRVQQPSLGVFPESRDLYKTHTQKIHLLLVKAHRRALDSGSKESKGKQDFFKCREKKPGSLKIQTSASVTVDSQSFPPFFVLPSPVDISIL